MRWFGAAALLTFPGVCAESGLYQVLYVTTRSDIGVVL
jgi:hypothetical protein